MSNRYLLGWQVCAVHHQSVASEEPNCWSEVWSRLASEELFVFELDDQMMSVSVMISALIRDTRFMIMVYSCAYAQLSRINLTTNK